MSNRSRFKRHPSPAPARTKARRGVLISSCLPCAHPAGLFRSLAMATPSIMKVGRTKDWCSLRRPSRHPIRSVPFGLASARAEPIRSLDPIKDRGCIIVRHHLSEAAAVGYIACVMDMPRTELHETGQMLWQTREGMFPLLRRLCGKGQPDNVVVYITSKPIESGALSGQMDIVHHIVFPDGSNTRDADVLLDEDDPNRS